MSEPTKNTAFQPAPWESGKPQQPAGYGQPQPLPQPQPQHPAIPIGGPASAAFGGDDSGRRRTRQIPAQNAGTRPIGQAAPPAYPQQPAPMYQQPPAYPPQAPNYPQQAPAYPPQAPAYPPQQQPYGGQPYPTRKPTTLLGILSLAAIGVSFLTGLMLFGLLRPPLSLCGALPVLIAGGVLGYLGIRETAAWGKKSGRGLAIGGTIGNAGLLLVNCGVLLLSLLVVQTADNFIEKNNNSMVDAEVIRQGVDAYAKAKGDLQPGGPQIRYGSKTEVAVAGPQLTVADVVAASELKNPIEEYSMTVDGAVATIYWTDATGFKQPMATYSKFGSWDGNWDGD